jgi:predicted acyl esterase
VERGDIDQRSDVVCFTSAPLAQDLQLCGRPELVQRSELRDA